MPTNPRSALWLMGRSHGGELRRSPIEVHRFLFGAKDTGEICVIRANPEIWWMCFISVCLGLLVSQLKTKGPWITPEFILRKVCVQQLQLQIIYGSFVWSNKSPPAVVGLFNDKWVFHMKSQNNFTWVLASLSNFTGQFRKEGAYFFSPIFPFNPARPILKYMFKN